MKIAICGVWHVHADDYCSVASRLAEVVGVYDADAKRRAAFCEKHSLPELKSIDEVKASGAEGAIVCARTCDHADLIVALANAGLDVFTEKVLAVTSEECDRIERAVRDNGVKFVISLPHKYFASVKTAKKIADSGALGKINYFRCRNAHSGSIYGWLPPHFYDRAECGGGAMIDLGAHGMYVSEWFCGMPQSAKSAFTLACSLDKEQTKNYDGVEDNAVTVMQYENGCIAVNETGFVTSTYPLTYEIVGEKGHVMVYGADKVELHLSGQPDSEVELEPALPLPIEQFCTGKLLDGCGIKEAKNLTRLMEMAYAE